MTISKLEFKEMTLSEFIKDLLGEIKKHKDWGDKELEFCTVNGSGLKYLSVYDSSENDNVVCIDVGTEEEDAEYTKAVLG